MKQVEKALDWLLFHCADKQPQQRPKGSKQPCVVTLGKILAHRLWLGE